MPISQEDLNDLGLLILRKIYEEFDVKHLSGNLMNTLQIIAEKDSVKIVIPALKYNMSLYQREGVVVPNGRGSYASILDSQGSEFYIYPDYGRKGSYLIKPHNHIGYIEKVITEALREWMNGHNYVMASKVD